jgi:hypothetical protein
MRFVFYSKAEEKSIKTIYDISLFIGLTHYTNALCQILTHYFYSAFRGCKISKRVRNLV